MLEYDRLRLGKLLKTARENADMTQAASAAHLGYTSAQFISNIERGISVVPLGTLRKMIRLYKADSEEVADVILDGQKALLQKALLKSESRRSFRKVVRSNSRRYEASSARI